MAKGRTLTISRSERFFGSYGYNGNDHDAVDNDVELREDDVWSMVDDVVNGTGSNEGDQHIITSDWTSRASMGGATRSRGRAGGLSVVFDDQPVKMAATSKRIVHQFRNGSDSMASPRGRHVATSAPVNVPDWSKIYRVDSVESMHDSDDGTDEHDSDMVPPHEYLVRSHRSAAKSVFEGVGRTLKGRDMSRVRDAVWSQTGFDG
ncbi:putative senescence regulator S40 [Helianthus anomalus]